MRRPESEGILCEAVEAGALGVVAMWPRENGASFRILLLDLSRAKLELRLTSCAQAMEVRELSGRCILGRRRR